MPDFQNLSKNWNQFYYPWKPWKKSLDVISPYVKKSKNVCILGATYELRKLCKDMNVTVDVYDTSPEMIQANFIKNSQEQVFLLDWFKIENKCYDLIIGDLILFLIPEERQNKLLSVLKENLAPNGKILLRCGEQNESWNIQRLKYIVEKMSIDIPLLNYLSFELVVWKKYTREKIKAFLKEYNPEWYKLFQNTFRELCPYGKTLPEQNTISHLGKKIYEKNFEISKEVIIDFS